jgi:hypothetical protein
MNIGERDVSDKKISIRAATVGAVAALAAIGASAALFVANRGASHLSRAQANQILLEVEPLISRTSSDALKASLDLSDPRTRVLKVAGDYVRLQLDYEAFSTTVATQEGVPHSTDLLNELQGQENRVLRHVPHASTILDLAQG